MIHKRQPQPQSKFQWEDLPNIERTRIMDILVKHQVEWSPIFMLSVTLKPADKIVYYTVELFNGVKIYYKTPWIAGKNPMENPNLVYSGESVTAEYVKKDSLPMHQDRTFIIDTNVVIFHRLRSKKLEL